MITFEHPLFFLIIVVYLLCLKFCKTQKQTIYFSNMKLLKSITSKKYLFVELVKFFFVVLISTALSTPVQKDEIKFKNNKAYEISLVFDISGSMRESNKFNISKEILIDFIKKREADQIALSIFADFAYVASPLTYDKQTILKLLQYLEVGVVGNLKTALYEAIFLSSKLFENSKNQNKIAIVLTDGFDTANTVPLDVAIDKAKEQGIKIYTIGIGNSSDYNAEVLEQIALKTNGKFFQANTKERLKDIYDIIDKSQKTDIKNSKYIKIKHYFEYILYFASILLVLLMIIDRK